MAETFEQLFEAELVRNGVAYDVSGDDQYQVESPNGERTINVANIRATFDRDGDRKAIESFVSNLLRMEVELPAWLQSKAHLFPKIEPVELNLGPETIMRPLSDKARIALAHHEEGGGTIRYIRHLDIERWGVSVEDAWEQAYQMLGQRAAGTKIETIKAGDLPLGLVHAGEPYKASLILSKHLKEQVLSTLGWPVLAVAPSRDFVYLIRESDRDQLGRLGNVVIREYKKSGYPVSTEIWELSDTGVEAFGHFPVE